MARFKVIDSEQLDGDLIDVADAIRLKGSTTDPLAFPEGFIAAVQNIPDFLKMRVTNTLTAWESDCTIAYNYSFAECGNLKSVRLTQATHLYFASFMKCASVVDVYAPNAWYVGSAAFQQCTALTVLDLPSLSRIDGSAFNKSGLTSLIIRRSAGVCTLQSTGAFTDTPIGAGTGYIYVPRTLDDGTDGVAAYQAATNWSTYADQIRAIEDYPEITGGAAT